MDIRLIAPIATLMASALATYLWWLNKQQKRLSIFTIRSEPLIALKGAARKKMKVFFGDKPIQNTFLLHLSLRNDGNMPVALTDYQAPIRIELNPDAKLLEVDLIESWPADLDRRIPAQLQSQTGLIKASGTTWLEITPVLLNPQDEIVLQLLVENFNGQLEVRQHVNGVKRVEFWQERRLIPKAFTVGGACILVYAAFFLEPDAPYLAILPSVPYMMIISLGGLLFLSGLLWPKSERARQFAYPSLASISHGTEKSLYLSEGK